jgi:hypothetical protein
MVQIIEQLQKIIIENGLPRTERTIFGLKCPYCGKSDRIRELESPQTLKGSLAFSALSEYLMLWQHVMLPDSTLGVCKFCQHPLRIPSTGAQAAPLIAFDE